jgi:hypothetical protein
MVAAIAEHERGVGHGARCSDNENAVAAVRGASGCRRYAIPLSVVPALGQVTEDVSESGSKEAWDVFQQNSSWSK